MTIRRQHRLSRPVIYTRIFLETCRGLAVSTGKRDGQTYLPIYDGNGNIMSYLNASTKTSVAEYVYDAFGRTISSSARRPTTSPIDSARSRWTAVASTTTVTVITIPSTAGGSAAIRLRKMEA